MTIISFSFLIFVAAVVFLYFLFPIKHRWILLLVSSYAFYYLAHKQLPIYIFSTSILVYLSALLIGCINEKQIDYLANHKEIGKEEKKLYKQKNERKKKVVLILTLIINVGTLIFFKYNGLFSILSDKFDLFSNIIAPLGISYYTFQSAGYLIDVYRDTSKANKNIGKVLLFISFFPQIFQGPIGKYNDLSPSLFSGNKFSFIRLKQGVILILIGLFKKIVLATYLGNIVDGIYGNYQSFDGFQILIAMLLFGIRLYFDFSGYMDIVSGVSEILGVKLARNFDKPFTSKSVVEFWRRWHMSLGEWFKDYLFYPILRSGWCLKLQKNISKRKSRSFASKVTSAIALTVLWGIIGLWHGGSLNFLIYGLSYGLIMICDILLRSTFEKINEKIHLNDKSIVWNTIRCLRVYAVNCVLWVVFYFNNMTDVARVLAKAFSSPIPKGFTPSYLLPEIGVYGTIGYALVVIATIAFLFIQFKGYNSREFTNVITERKSWILQTVIIVSLVLLTYYMREATLNTVGGFLYEQF